MYKLNIKTFTNKRIFSRTFISKMISEISFRKAHKKCFMLSSSLIISRGEFHSKQLKFWAEVKIFQLYCAEL